MEIIIAFAGSLEDEFESIDYLIRFPGMVDLLMSRAENLDFKAFAILRKCIEVAIFVQYFYYSRTMK